MNIFKPFRLTFISPFQDEARRRRQAGEGLEFKSTSEYAASLEQQNKLSPVIEDSVSAIETPQNRVDSFGNVWKSRSDGSEVVVSGGKGDQGTIAKTEADVIGKGLLGLEETQRNLMSDAQSQVFAAIEQQRKAGIAAGETATSNINAPLAARTAGQIGTRGGFTANTASTRGGAVELARSKAIQNDPRVIDAANQLRSAQARLNAASSNVQTIQQEKTNRLAQQELQSAQENFNRAIELVQPTAQNEAMDAINATLDNFSTEDLANISAESITQLVNSNASQYGVTDSTNLLTTALAKKAMADQIAKTKDPEVQAGLLQTFNQLGISPSKEIQVAGGIENLRNRILTETDPEKKAILQDALDSLIDGDNKTQELQKASSIGITIPQGKYESSITPSGNNVGAGIRLQVEDGESGGQCGRFVNEAIGQANYFGDSFLDKKARINQNNPTVGSAFVMSTRQPYGHTGIVEQVFDDGSIAVVESNWGLDEKVSRRIINNTKAAGIVGYYNQNLGEEEFSTLTQQDQTKLNSLIQEYNKTETPSGKDAVKDKIVEAGLLSAWIEKTEIPLEHKKGFKISVAGLPQKIKDSPKEMGAFQEIAIPLLKEGTDPFDVADIFFGFDISSFPKEDKAFVKLLRNKLIQADAGDDAEKSRKIMEGLGRLVNSKDYEAATRFVENAVLKDTELDFAFPEKTINILDKVNRALSLVDSADPDLLGAYDAAQFKFLDRPTGGAFTSDEKLKATQQLQSALTNIFSAFRKNYAGVAVTETELEYLKDMMADISDQPEILKTKIEELRNSIIIEHNAARKARTLPEIDLNGKELTDYKLNVSNYRNEADIKRNDLLGTNGNIYSSLFNTVLDDITYNEFLDYVNNASYSASGSTDNLDTWLNNLNL